MKDTEIIEQFQKLSSAELRIILERELGKRSLYEYFLLCMENMYPHLSFVDNWHYKITCDILQERTEKVLRHEKDIDLLINEPIRCLKTILISQIYPTWVWIISDGKLMIQNVCATQKLATESSRISKLIITSPWFQERWPEVKLAKDNKSKSDYGTTNGGKRVSFGIDSSIIGSSYDVLIVDDANDPKDKHSDVAINNVISTYQDVVSGRMNREWGMRVILQQRTSERDLCGFLLNNNRNSFRHICLPAELTKDVSPEFRQYYVDGLFFPKLWSRENLNKRKEDSTPAGYASQMLQSPAAVEGDIIKRIWFPKINKNDFVNISSGSKNLMFMDTAFTSNEKRDPSSFYICSLINKRIYILHIERQWYEFNNLIEQTQKLINDYNIKEVYIEKKASGLSVISELRRFITKTSIIGLDPGAKSKTERAYLCQSYMVNGNIIPVEGTWNNLFWDEISNFPYGKHDDICDVLVYSIITLLINRYSVKSIMTADKNKEYQEKNAFLNDKPEQTYY